MPLPFLFAMMLSMRDGDLFVREGERAEIRKDFAAARQLYDYALAEDPNDADYHARRKQIEAKIPKVEKPQVLAVIVLQPVNQAIHHLELNHRSTRELYAEVGREAGIQVEFDPTSLEGPATNDPEHIFRDLSEVLLEGALDAIAQVTNTTWKAISSDTILVSRRSVTEPNRSRPVEPSRPFSDLSGLPPEEALQVAIRERMFADAVRLVVQGADVKRLNPSNGRTVLDDVCAIGQPELIPLLVEFGADPTQRDHFGQTPLNLALEYENEKAVAALLALSGPHEQMLAVAAEAMDDAANRGYTEMARILLDHGVDPNRMTPQGATYLGNAALKGQAAMVGLLLDHGAKRDAPNRFGNTALQDAALGRNAEVVKLLLARGAAVDARNALTGTTAPMMTAEMGNLEAAKVLLHSGANPLLKDDAGRSALDRAKAAGKGEMVELLLQERDQSPLVR